MTYKIGDKARIAAKRMCFRKPQGGTAENAALRKSRADMTNEERVRGRIAEMTTAELAWFLAYNDDANGSPLNDMESLCDGCCRAPRKCGDCIADWLREEAGK